jgi:gamma-glutamyltranspeptidase / glutathione hydrolase
VRARGWDAMLRDPEVAMPRLACVLGIVLLMGTSRASGGDRITGLPFATRSEVIATHGMAATSHPLATQIALDVLKQGGSAVDAAIAANAALGLMEPTGSGVGGDLFAIVWDPSAGKLVGFNGSGRSPRAFTLAHWKDRGIAKIPRFGALSVSVPGAVDAWSELHGRFGKRPWAENLEPAIRYAREGFPVTEVIAAHWARNVPALAEYPNVKEQFTYGGRAPGKGEIWKNPNLAQTLEQIAAGGRKAFYEGALARAIADHVKAQGGFLAFEDLAAHRGEWVEPVSTNYRGYDVWELPPNSQGIAALQMLNILEGFDLKAMGFGSVDALHVMVEAKKLAFEDRAKFYADPACAAVPVAGLLAKDYAAERRKLIRMDRAAKTYDAGDPLPVSGDTVYLTTADASGMMVSLIQSNFRGMGSGMAPPGLGFILQNRGELFSLVEGHANCYAPGKRPFQTIIPAFLTKDGKPFVAFGVMGGDMQPQGHVQIVVNLVDFGMNLQEAGDAPRWRHGGSSEPTGERMSDGGLVEVESGFRSDVVRALDGRGHDVRLASYEAFGGYQAIARRDGVYYGASEGRKDGHAAGW